MAWVESGFKLPATLGERRQVGSNNPTSELDSVQLESPGDGALFQLYVRKAHFEPNGL